MVKTMVFGQMVTGKVVDENDTHVWVEAVIDGITDTYKKEKAEVTEVKTIEVKDKVIACTDGKERVFTIYGKNNDWLAYAMFKDGKKFGKTFSTKLDKMPKFVTMEMLLK